MNELIKYITMATFIFTFATVPTPALYWIGPATFLLYVLSTIRNTYYTEGERKRD